MYLVKNSSPGAEKKSVRLQLVKPEQKPGGQVFQNKLLNLIELCRVVTTAQQKSDIITCIVKNLGQYIGAEKVYFVEKVGDNLARLHSALKTGTVKNMVTSRLSSIVAKEFKHPHYCSSLELLGLNFDSKNNRVYLVPLVNDGHSYGYIVCLGNHTLGQVTRLDEEVIKTFANNAALALSHLGLAEKIKTDSLTGLNTREVLLEKYQQRNGENKVALILFDLDHFKRINDSFGHLKGDEILRGVGQVTRSVAKAATCCARMGGEEFAIMVENFTPGQVKGLVKELQEGFARLKAGDQPVTASFGTATLDENTAFDFAYDKVDEAMYAAKRKGRNCSVKAVI